MHTVAPMSLLHRVIPTLVALLLSSPILLAQEYRNVRYGFAVTFPKGYQKPVEHEERSWYTEGENSLPYPVMWLRSSLAERGIISHVFATFAPLGSNLAQSPDSVREQAFAVALVQYKARVTSRRRSLRKSTTVFTYGLEGSDSMGMPLHGRIDLHYRDPLIVAVISVCRAKEIESSLAFTSLFASLRLLPLDSMRYQSHPFSPPQSSCWARAPVGFVLVDTVVSNRDVGGGRGGARVSGLRALSPSSVCFVMQVDLDYDPADSIARMEDLARSLAGHGVPGGNEGDLNTEREEPIERYEFLGIRKIMAGSLDGAPMIARMEYFLVGRRVFVAGFFTHDLLLRESVIIRDFFDSFGFSGPPGQEGLRRQKMEGER